MMKRSITDRVLDRINGVEHEARPRTVPARLANIDDEIKSHKRGRYINKTLKGLAGSAGSAAIITAALDAFGPEIIETGLSPHGLAAVGSLGVAAIALAVSVDKDIDSNNTIIEQLSELKANQV